MLPEGLVWQLIGGYSLSLRATACIPGLSEAEAEAGVKDSAEDGSVTRIVHQNPLFDSIEYER